MKELGQKQQAKEKTVKMDAFNSYHQKVVQVFKDLFDELRPLIGEESKDVEQRFDSVYQA